MSHTLADDQKQSAEHFTRTRKLSLPNLITLVLSLVTSDKSAGVDIHSGEFFKQARRSGCWPEAEAVHRSAVTKARSRLPWSVFTDLLADSVQLAYSLWPESPEYTWHGMTAVAFDGSKYHLPASPELRKAFDPNSGLTVPGKGHYPQCLVSTAFDVFRRLPIARAISPLAEGNEREDVKELLPQLPDRPLVLLFDRGYPSYDLLYYLRDTSPDSAFVFRCPAQSTFKAVENFVQSGRSEAVIWLDTASRIRRKRPGPKSIKLRVVRLESPDGTLSVLLTNLTGSRQYPAESLVELYFRRWRIEEQYRDEKLHLDIEMFHSHSENGIRQELLAVLVMCVISRTLIALLTDPNPDRLSTPQFKNAVRALASEVVVFTAAYPEIARNVFQELLVEITRVQYYHPKKPRKSYPRVSRKPINKWQQDKSKRIADA
ncbi:IS4 family transposase [Methylotuvimicrobium sp. KM1]|uniref:IS4 family transposase n=1 Tax=Methylotuvimicrobium sp. KM1 TaxID=3377707 RepID=UPI00384F553B